MINGLLVDHLLSVILFGCTMFGERNGENAKLDCPREGPYLVISALSDVVSRIQKSRKAKPKTKKLPSRYEIGWLVNLIAQ